VHLGGKVVSNGGINAFEEGDDEPLMNEANRVVLLWHELGVNESVLNPSMYESKMELARSCERDDKLLAKRCKRLLVKRP